MRDNDKSKVYEAEFQVRRIFNRPGTIQMFGTHIAVPEERKFGRVEDVQRYVDAVMDHLGMDRQITVRQRKGVQFAHYERAGHIIAVPDADWALREIVLLHEIAHHLTRDSDDGAHGASFRSAFCGLMEDVLAPEARFLLQVAFSERGLSA